MSILIDKLSTEITNWKNVILSIEREDSSDSRSLRDGEREVFLELRDFWKYNDFNPNPAKDLINELKKHEPYHAPKWDELGEFRRICVQYYTKDKEVYEAFQRNLGGRVSSQKPDYREDLKHEYQSSEIFPEVGSGDSKNYSIQINDIFFMDYSYSEDDYEKPWDSYALANGHISNSDRFYHAVNDSFQIAPARKYTNKFGYPLFVYCQEPENNFLEEFPFNNGPFFWTHYYHRIYGFFKKQIIDVYFGGWIESPLRDKNGVPAGFEFGLNAIFIKTNGFFKFFSLSVPAEFFAVKSGLDIVDREISERFETISKIEASGDILKISSFKYPSSGIIKENYHEVILDKYLNKYILNLYKHIRSQGII
jgi:hypothetical protein